MTQVIEKGDQITTRFGLEWTALTGPDRDGYLIARRTEDGKERPVHISDVAKVEKQASGGETP